MTERLRTWIYSKKWVFLAGIATIFIIGVILTSNEDRPPVVHIAPEKYSVITSSNIKNIEQVQVIEQRGWITFDQSETVFVIVNQNDGIYVGNYATGESLLNVDMNAQIRGLAINPNGNEFTIATTYYGGERDTISLWSIPEKRQIGTLRGHKDLVNDVVYSADGKLLASASFDKTVRIWDVNTKKMINVFEGHTDYVSNVRFSPDGQLILSAGGDGTIRIWDIKSKEETQIITVNNDRYQASYVQPLYLSFSMLDGSLAVTYEDNKIRLWSIANHRIIRELQGNYMDTSTAFTPDGTIMASMYRSGGSGTTLLRLWNTVTWDLLKEIPFEQTYFGLGHIEFTSDGKFFTIDTGTSHKIEFWGIPVDD